MIDVIVGLSLILLLSCVCIYSVLRFNRLLALSGCIILMIFSTVSYYLSGHYQALADFRSHQQRLQQAKSMLNKIKDPNEVVNKLEAHLKSNPNSAKGWYLLGRLYASNQKFSKALRCFKKAYLLKPKVLRYQLQYVQAIYVNNNMVFDGEARDILETILKKDPRQLDALNLLASDAYTHGKYQQASEYWQTMLTVLPDGSDEKKVILKAIAKVQKANKIKG